ncbi:DPY30/SDC1 family protein [Aspergillus ibericus CBS 121593]|uniref:Putative COMPASS complex subunit Sdc1 n=1 Tax=Aspergillus ibericus CBS 121593 TaxID=1448316 RepID=A0A395GU77_9EURO|nr:putative COMPASS complex subunit Sdc1 [Aspergillus ibericus CBS 121593]RAK98972.1 putative COMPASS complex subunit Sdc1 [Aspergillus ibericus CBS 121593]
MADEIPDSAANTPGGDSAAATPITNTQVRPGGAPARVYMNEKIVPYLLEGMKSVTKEQPANPLRVLGEFLIQKSMEVEQGATKTPE